MRLLLDSHALLWWLLDDRRLSDAAQAAIERRDSLVFVSAASLWEIGIKAAKGKLQLPEYGARRIREEMVAAGWIQLAVTWDHGLAVRDLPAVHLDPFDRLLVVQSRMEDLTLVTNDRLLARYDVDVLW